MIALRDELDAALPPLPPSSVDVDRVMVRARRGTRLRVAAGAAGTTALVAGLVLLSAVVRPGPGPAQISGHSPTLSAGPVGSGGSGGPDSSGSPSSSVSSGGPGTTGRPDPTGDPAPPKVQGRPDIDRLNALLLAAFQRAAPEVPTVVSYQGQPADPNVSCAPGEPQTSPGSCGTPLPVKYDLTFSMHQGNQYSHIDVLVGTAATMPVECATDTPGQPSPNSKCHHTVVNGVTVLDMSSDVQGDTTVHYYAVAAVHPDGTVVEVFVNAPVVGATPFITKDQAVAVAIDPSVSLHP